MNDEFPLIIIDVVKRAQFLCWAVYLRSTQNRRQKVFNRRALRLCRRAWHVKI